ncbi:hypothetical protein VTO42DRAFT_6088 [Malbranchea cinnamomea]
MEKSVIDMEGISLPPRPPRRRQSMILSSLIAACVCLAIFVYTHPPGFFGRLATRKIIHTGLKNEQERLHQQTPLDEPPSSARVPLEAHIMSKCPDARDCMQQLVVPSMEQIDHKVDFRLSFIGNASSSSDAVSCKHGPGECIGNMLILCAANLPFPPSDDNALSPSQSGKTPTVRSVGFANCLLSSYAQIPERALIEDCAAEYGINFAALNHCASRSIDIGGGHGGDDDQVSGLKLLRESFMRSAALGIKTSCTLRLDEKVWCVRDGGEWRDCGESEERSQVSTLVEEIERLWKERN